MSRLPFELLLALRYLRPKRTFVSIITLISVLGVTLGVAVLIIVISVMSGFDSEMREKVLGFTAHMQIFQVDTATGKLALMENYPAIVKKVAGNDLIRSVMPFTQSQVMLESEPAPPTEPKIEAPFLRGMDPADGTNGNQLTSKILSGKFDLSDRGLVVGASLAERMNLNPGDRVAILSPNELEKILRSGKTNNETMTLPDDYVVRGIFDSGFYEYNSTVVIGALEDFQELFAISNRVQGLMVMLKDPNQSEVVRRQLQPALGDKYRITIWQQENNATTAAVMAEKNVMFYILFFIVIVAAFGITCTLITFVVLKTREIGVLKALGASSRQIAWVFLSQSMTVSIIGVAIGLGVGLLGVTYRNPFLLMMRRVTGMELFPSSVYEFYELPALIVPSDIAIICGGSFVICLLAAAFPVWKASRLKPVEALRHE